MKRIEKKAEQYLIMALWVLVKLLPTCFLFQTTPVKLEKNSEMCIEKTFVVGTEN